MDKIQQIRAEIERRFNDNIDAAMLFSEESEPRQLFASAANEDMDILSFIDSLTEQTEEIPQKLPLISPKVDFGFPLISNKTDTNAAMEELEEKIKMFSEAHRGETTDEILAQMRGEEPKDSNIGENGKNLQDRTQD